MNTVSQIFPEMAELVGRKLEMVPNWMFQQMTDKTKKKKQKTRDFQKFSSGDGNESLQSPSPSVTGFNMQASVTKIVTSERRESPH